MDGEVMDNEVKKIKAWIQFGWLCTYCGEIHSMSILEWKDKSFHNCNKCERRYIIKISGD